MKARDHCLETGYQTAYASDTLGNRRPSAGFPGGTPLLAEIGKRVSSGRKIHLKPSAEFIAAIAFLGDASVVFGSLVAGFWTGLRSGLNLFSSEASATSQISHSFSGLSLCIPGTILLLGLYAALRLYNRKCFTSFSAAAKIILVANAFWLFVMWLVFDSFAGLQHLIASVLFSSVCASVAMSAWRYLFQKVLSWKTLSADLCQKVVFVGWGKESERLEEEIRRDKGQLFDVIGYLPSPQNRSNLQPPTRVPVLGDYTDLPGLLRQRRADVVMLADLNMSLGEITELANLCEMEFAQFKVIPSYFPILASGLRLESISGVPVLGVSALPLDSLSNRLLKRIIDIFGAIVGLVLSFPIVAVFGALVYWESPGPIFYRQTRTGKNGHTFKMIKIRSMRLDAEKDGKAQWCKEVDPRRLKVGSLMRKWNVDEVPQFWNVLKGEMSLVGPRPERPELIANFERTIPHYHARHACLPGITGWAQVNGWRGDTSLEQRILYDIWYVENWSLWLDLRIMILTLGDSTMIRQSGAY